MLTEVAHLGSGPSLWMAEHWQSFQLNMQVSVGGGSSKTHQHLPAGSDFGKEDTAESAWSSERTNRLYSFIIHQLCCNSSQCRILWTSLMKSVSGYHLLGYLSCALVVVASFTSSNEESEEEVELLYWLGCPPSRKQSSAVDIMFPPVFMLAYD